MERKKAERAERLPGAAAPAASESADSPGSDSVKAENSELLLGMLCFFSGIRDGPELAAAAEKCRRLGRDLQLDPDTEKTCGISSRRLEGERLRSSRSLFS